MKANVCIQWILDTSDLQKWRWMSVFRPKAIPDQPCPPYATAHIVIFVLQLDKQLNIWSDKKFVYDEAKALSSL